MGQNFEEVSDQVYYPLPSDIQRQRAAHLDYVRRDYGIPYPPSFFECATQATDRLTTARQQYGPEPVLWTPFCWPSHLLVELPPGSVVRESLDFQPVHVEGDEPLYVLYEPVRPSSKTALAKIYGSVLSGEDHPTFAVDAKTYLELAQQFFAAYDNAPIPQNNYAYGYTLDPFQYIVSRSKEWRQRTTLDDYGRDFIQALTPYYSLYLMAGAFGLFLNEPRSVLLTRAELLNPLNQAPKRRIANITQPL